MKSSISSIQTYFNPRSREGSDGYNRNLVASNRYFNPRSREGSDTAVWYDLSALPNFNPRSREGSDANKTWEVVGKLISIHAPAKGATTSQGVACEENQYFNPRSREGSDSFKLL